MSRSRRSASLWVLLCVFGSQFLFAGASCQSAAEREEFALAGCTEDNNCADVPKRSRRDDVFGTQCGTAVSELWPGAPSVPLEELCPCSCEAFAKCRAASAVRRCDLQVLDGTELTLEEFESTFRRDKPVVLTGLTSEWAAADPVTGWTNSTSFAERYGDFDLPLRAWKALATKGPAHAGKRTTIKKYATGSADGALFSNLEVSPRTPSRAAALWLIRRGTGTTVDRFAGAVQLA